MPSDRRILVDCVQQYCYCRERKYCPFDDLNDFGYVVKVKENAPELLRRGLSRAPVDVVEALANECYWMQLENAPGQWAWAYRKGAWAIEDLEQDVGLIYRTMGRKGLEGIENVGPRLAEVVEGRISKWT